MRPGAADAGRVASALWGRLTLCPRGRCRTERRDTATEALEEAKEVRPGRVPPPRPRARAPQPCRPTERADAQTGGEADVAKYSKRTVRVTRQHNEECRRLLRLMGVPVVEVRPGPARAPAPHAPRPPPALLRAALHRGRRTRRRPPRRRRSARRCARRAWCAPAPPAACARRAPSAARAGLQRGRRAEQVYGTASEDMDSLTFATPKLIRNLMKPVTQSVPINEYDYDKARPRRPPRARAHALARPRLHRSRPHPHRLARLPARHFLVRAGCSNVRVGAKAAGASRPGRARRCWRA